MSIADGTGSVGHACRASVAQRDVPKISILNHYELSQKGMREELRGSPVTFYVGGVRDHGCVNKAMAQGMPVIAADLEGRRELVQDGQNGFLCGTTVDSLRAALNRAAELGQEDYDRMSACAKATAAAYSEDRIMKLQLALYKELLSE